MPPGASRPRPPVTVIPAAAPPRPRLSDTTLGQAAPDVARPAYDRRRLDTGIVHLGLGAFVRAHAAVYTDTVLAEAQGPWGILGVSLQRPDQRDRLAPQDGLYTTITRDGPVARARIIGCVTGVLVAPEDPAAVTRALAAPATRIVSLTITEKGYGRDPATGGLDLDHPDIRHDLDATGAPRSAVGHLVAGLAARRTAGQSPFTVLCCDNLPHNGRLVERLVHDFADRRDPALAAWIARHGAFPATMVDRIVPAATPEDRAEAGQLTGLDDAAPVAHEPFTQWVVEDRFVDGVRPAWERAGVQFAADVAPYEAMKLRLLNGAHSALAYLGYLAGHQTIDAAVADPALRAFVQRLWQHEIIPVTPAPPGTDMQHYTSALLARFDNAAVRHRTWQIAMDGSQKLPMRLLATIEARLARDLPIPGLALAVAGWIRYVGGRDEAGRTIDVRDPLAVRLAALISGAAPDAGAVVDAVLGVEQVFTPRLAADTRFRAAVRSAYRTLLDHGARAAAAEVADRH